MTFTPTPRPAAMPVGDKIRVASRRHKVLASGARGSLLAVDTTRGHVATLSPILVLQSPHSPGLHYYPYIRRAGRARGCLILGIAIICSRHPFPGLRAWMVIASIWHFSRHPPSFRNPDQLPKSCGPVSRLLRTFITWSSWL